jgi:uncharacterized protein
VPEVQGRTDDQQHREAMTAAPPPVFINDLTRPYWDAARQGQLVIQRCQACRTYIHLPRPVCRACESFDLAFEPVSGRGTLFTFTETHKVFHPYYADKVPFFLATIELEEQAHLLMLSNLVGVARADVRFGMAVKVQFEWQTPELAIPVFTSAEEKS